MSRDCPYRTDSVLQDWEDRLVQRIVRRVSSALDGSQSSGQRRFSMQDGLEEGDISPRQRRCRRRFSEGSVQSRPKMNEGERGGKGKFVHENACRRRRADSRSPSRVYRNKRRRSVDGAGKLVRCDSSDYR